MFTRYIAYSATLLGLSLARATPYATPSDDGFPNSNAQQLLSIEKQAGGLLSNAPPPRTLSQAGIANFQLIAFNENFEVGFFDNIIKNITNHVPGFEIKSSFKWAEADILEILKTVKAVSSISRLKFGLRYKGRIRS